MVNSAYGLHQNHFHKEKEMGLCHRTLSAAGNRRPYKLTRPTSKGKLLPY